MKRKNNILIGIILSIISISCTETLVVDLPAEDDRVVIEGLVTTQTKPFVVKLSKTVELGGSSYPSIDNATVVIADNVGNSDSTLR